MSVFGGETYQDLEPRRLFPLSGLTRYITLLDTDKKEVAIVRDLSLLDADSRIALQQCLDEFYMIPKIYRVISITDKFGIITWHCQTNHGERSFVIKNRNSDIKSLYDGRVLLRDSNDNRYEIENVALLDKRSQHLLASEL
jgi:hypothetical protein